MTRTQPSASLSSQNIASSSATHAFKAITQPSAGMFGGGALLPQLLLIRRLASSVVREMMKLTLEGLRIDCCYPDIQAIVCGLQLYRRLGRHKHHACKTDDVLACRRNPTVPPKGLRHKQ